MGAIGAHLRCFVGTMGIMGIMGFIGLLLNPYFPYIPHFPHKRVYERPHLSKANGLSPLALYLHLGSMLVVKKSQWLMANG